MHKYVNYRCVTGRFSYELYVGDIERGPVAYASSVSLKMISAVNTLVCKFLL